ncbi:MAG: helix-turn-helix transcriptional regulator [Prevotella sp.]|nr:helix-turn-helix transcriptional regulator [Prevotella sp.]
MVFSEYINSLPGRSNPKVDVINKIARACLVGRTTVYRWASGVYTPDALKRKTISEVLRIPEEELFPDA